MVIDSPSLLQVRDRARLEGTEIGARYCECYELDRESANLIPADAIGRILNREEVHKLVQRLKTRNIPKKSVPPSVSPKGLNPNVAARAELMPHET